MNSLCVLMNSCACVESIGVPGREFLNEATPDVNETTPKVSPAKRKSKENEAPLFCSSK